MAAESERFRFLGEIVVSDEEREVERLQFGYRITPETTLWIGRHHNPLGYWNVQFHHGTFLQTSISRPAIIEFEDEGGVLPSHIAGLFLEGKVKGGRHAVEYELSVGVGPELLSNDSGTVALEPLDILNPGGGDHALSWGARVSYLPQSYGLNQFGAFINHVKIPTQGLPFDELVLLNTGIFSVLESQNFVWMGAIFFTRDQLQLMNDKNTNRFMAGYLQLEYNAGSSWTTYGRIEASSNVSDDPYLAMYPNLTRSKQILGIRYDIGRRQAVKVEFSRNETSDSDFNRLQVNWSAAYT